MGKRIRRGRDFKNSLASKSQRNLLELTQYLSTGRGDALAQCCEEEPCVACALQKYSPSCERSKLLVTPG